MCLVDDPVVHKCSARDGQKGVSEPTDLELESCGPSEVGVGIKLCKHNTYS